MCVACRVACRKEEGEEEEEVGRERRGRRAVCGWGEEGKEMVGENGKGARKSFGRSPSGGLGR